MIEKERVIQCRRGRGNIIINYSCFSAPEFNAARKVPDVLMQTPLSKSSHISGSCVKPTIAFNFRRAVFCKALISFFVSFDQWGRKSDQLPCQTSFKMLQHSQKLAQVTTQQFFEPTPTPTLLFFSSVSSSSLLTLTDSGKIMRRILRQIARNEKDLGDLSTLADPKVVEVLFSQRCEAAAWTNTSTPFCLSLSSF